MSDTVKLDAETLRAMGIGHELLEDDDDLVATVEFLRDLGVELDEMIDEDLTYLAGPRVIRPDASTGPIDWGFGHNPVFAQRAALALGFHFDQHVVGLTPGEVKGIRFFESLVPVLGEDEVLGLLRVLGNAMARVARSVMSSLRLNYETPILEDTGSLVEVAKAYRSLTESTLPPFLDAAAVTLQRHLAVLSGQPTIWNVDRSNSATIETATVGFVDLVGFTSFTELADARQFIEALTAFETQVHEVVVANSGTLIKLIGDEAMFVAPTPTAGIEIARRLMRLSLSDGGPASVRIGLAAGELVAAGGDYYGTVVNIASRAVNRADPDTIVVTASVVAGAHASTEFEPFGTHDLRGISAPVELFRLVD